MTIPLNQKGQAKPGMICHNGICKPALDQAVKQGILNADGSTTAATKTYIKMVDNQLRMKDMSHENFIRVDMNGQVVTPVSFMIAAGLIDEATGLPTEKANSIISKMSQTPAADECSCKKKTKPAKKSGGLSQKRIEEIVADVFSKHKRSKNFLDTKSSGVPAERIPRTGIEALRAGSRVGRQSGQEIVNRLWGKKPSTEIKNNSTIVGKGLFRSTR